MATAIKTVVLQRNRHIDQWERTENTEMYAYQYDQQIFDKGSKAI